MRMAKSSPEEMEKMFEFFDRLEAIFEGEFEQDEVFGDYDDELQKAVGAHVVEWWEKFLDGSWARFYWGFDTMLRSVADPELSYLDFKPELRQKLDSQPELLTACQAACAWLGERKQGDWPYDRAVNELIGKLEAAISKAHGGAGDTAVKVDAELIKVKSKMSGVEIGATRADGNSPWVGYVNLDDGVRYFDNEQGRMYANLHNQQAQEFAAALNNK